MRRPFPPTMSSLLVPVLVLVRVEPDDGFIMPKPWDLNNKTTKRKVGCD
jgi:hypothetical protein